MRCILVALVLLLGLLPADAGQGRLQVVATFSVLGDFVKVVGGDDVELVTLVGANGDAHTFEPSPSDGVKLHRAALIFENGLGFEPWLDRIVKACGTKAKRVVVSSGVQIRHAAACEHEGEHAHDHGDANPHIWQSVARTRQIVGTIRDALSQHDPANAADFAERAKIYLQQLDELDGFIRQRVAALPESSRKLFTAHDTFGYFADDYGFEIMGSALGSMSTEVADPSAREFASLIDAVKASGVKAVFAENTHSSKFAKSLAHSAGVKVVDTLYTDALGESGTPGDTYLGMMRFNVDAIVAALSAD